MYCKYCGKEISDDSLFCEFCGMKLAEETPSGAESAVQETPAEPAETIPPAEADGFTEAPATTQPEIPAEEPAAEPAAEPELSDEVAETEAPAEAETPVESEMPAEAEAPAEAETPEAADDFTPADEIKEADQDVSVTPPPFGSFSGGAGNGPAPGVPAGQGFAPAGSTGGWQDAGANTNADAGVSSGGWQDAGANTNADAGVSSGGWQDAGANTYADAGASTGGWQDAGANTNADAGARSGGWQDAGANTNTGGWQDAGANMNTGAGGWQEMPGGNNYQGDGPAYRDTPRGGMAGGPAFGNATGELPHKGNLKKIIIPIVIILGVLALAAVVFTFTNNDNSGGSGSSGSNTGNYEDDSLIIPYEDLEKNVDKYAGEVVEFQGEVFEIHEENGEVIFVMDTVYDEDADMYFGGTLIITYDADDASIPEVTEWDLITVYGEVQEEKETFDSEYGEYKAPVIEAEKIKIDEDF